MENRRRDNLRNREEEQVRQGLEEEMNYMVRTLRMFLFESWRVATWKAGKAPTTTKWIDGMKKNNNGREFVRCRLGGAESTVLRSVVGCARRGEIRAARSETHFHRREERAVELLD